MFGFHVDRRFNSATMGYGVEHYLPFELRTRLVRQHVHVVFCPDTGGYMVCMCYWKREDFGNDSSALEFDAFYEVGQDTRLVLYDPATGEYQWKVQEYAQIKGVV